MEFALKYKITKHFLSHNFKNGNDYILAYLRYLENEKYKDEIEMKLHIGRIGQKIFDISRMMDSSQNYSIECELNTVLFNISNIELLRNLLYFFEPKW
jgi:hypothetical protein